MPVHGAAQRVDNHEQQLKFSRKRYLDKEQEVITVIQENTKRTEASGNYAGCICRIRMRLHVKMTLNDIYMSNDFQLISLRRISFYTTYICCIDIKRHIMLYNIYS